MNTFEKIEAIKHMLLSTVGSVLRYSWDDEYKLSSITSVIDTWITSCKEHQINPLVDPNDLCEAELRKLGFSKWDATDLFLVPVWLAKFLSPEATLESIAGETTKANQIDLDSRFGMLAYGVRPAKPVTILASIEKQAEDHALGILFANPEKVSYAAACEGSGQQLTSVGQALADQKQLVVTLKALKEEFISFYRGLYGER